MLTLHILGECRLTVAPAAGPAVTLAPDADRLFSLALVLAGERGRLVPRGQLAEWLWPELAAAGARRCLRQALYRLRAAGVPVIADADHLSLARAAVAATFAAAPTGAALRAAWADGSLRLGRCLPGWTPAGDAFAAWVDAYRDRVEGAARRALDEALGGAPNGQAPDDPFDDAPSRAAPPRAVLARALLALDPEHPVALAVARGRGPASAVREGAPPAYARAAPPAPASAESLNLLDARLAAARAGAGGLVVLAGPPGPEPSAVLAEFAARAAGVRVVYVDAAACAAGPRATGAGLPLTVARALVAAVPGVASDLVRALRRAPGGMALSGDVLGPVGVAAAEGGPVLVCLDHAEYAGAEALAAVADAASRWAEARALLVVACAGAWPAEARGDVGRVDTGPGAGGPAEEACGGAARRWGARLAEVAEAVAGGRPLLVRVAPADDR